ncbi:MAG: polysaccharide deacetylase family protein [Bacteroidales bacterium]|nr:polysaccharide deacetylase family protein [Bacteroidales bacterium]
MLKIQAPNTFIPEKTYIIDVLFGEFLGIEYKIEFKDCVDYNIYIGDKKIVFKDSFFANFNEKKGYLDEQNIPQNILLTQNRFCIGKNIPIIYGNEELEVTENIYCGIDIFASCYFMLSRWEENVIDQKDAHSRFPCELSLAQKNNFHQRAVVNEYLEMLWNMMQFLGCKQVRKIRNFEIIPTHDIDFLKQFSSFSKGIKNVFGDLIKRKNLRLSFESLKNFLGVKFFKKNDPFYTFDTLMSISEKNNLKSHFYFIAGKVGEADVKYNFIDSDIKILIEHILQRGHFVGMHGGYDSYDNITQLKTEIDRFEQYNLKISEARQHFLRFKIPETWQYINNLNIKYDSSIGYTNTSGFRAGSCYEYSVFDIKNRIKLNLIERPLIFMETVSQKTYSEISDFKNHLLMLKNIVKKYNGQFVILWHNSNINGYLWKEYFKLYSEILK